MPSELQLAERAARRHRLPADGVLINVDPTAGLGITRAEAAQRLGLSVGALRQMERIGVGPRVIRLSQRVARYPEHDLAEWIESRARGGRFTALR